MSKQKTYVADIRPSILSDGPLTYWYPIGEVSPEDRPRERLLKSGPEVLSTPELLAVVLNVGTKKEDVLSMSHRILKEYGEKSILSITDPNQLVEDLDIPLGRALQIVACAEIGKRFYKKNEVGNPVIRNAEAVFQYVSDMRNLSKEHLRGIYLNSHYKVIHDEIISIGTIDTSIIHPREVFKPALEYAAAAVILVHNHPSGNLEPSIADYEITTQLIQAGKMLGIPLIDHIIVTQEAFKSVNLDEK